MKYRYREAHEMKESGIEWMGLIPREWEVTPLKFITKINMGQSPENETVNIEKIGIPFYQGKSEFGKLNPIPDKYCSEPKRISYPKEILISVRAPVGDVNISDEICCIGRGLASIKAYGNYKYLYYSLIAYKNGLNSYSTGSTFEAISVSQLGNLEVIKLNKIEEQQKISDFLDLKCSQFDSTIEKQKQLIEKLKSAKQSLISEVVTGKIEVL